MRKLFTGRSFRCVVCLILVCCLVVSWSPIRARAVLLEASMVSVGAAAVVAAIIIGLGLMPGPDSTTAFDDLVASAEAALTTSGYVVNGLIDVFYVGSGGLTWDYGVRQDLLDWLHNWCYTGSSSASAVLTSPSTVLNDSQYLSFCQTLADWQTSFSGYDGNIMIFPGDSYSTILISRWAFEFTSQGYQTYYNGYYQPFNHYQFYTDGTCKSVGQVTSLSLDVDPIFVGTGDFLVDTSFDLTLGQVALPEVEIETGYEEWADIGQIIIVPGGLPETGGDSGDDDPVQIPLLPIPVGPDYQTIIQTPQEEIWKGNKVETEDPDTGGSTDPTTGTDTDDPDSGSNDPTTPTTGTDNPDSPGDDGSQDVPLTPDQLQPFVVDLRDFFPFCIPFDLYDFFQLLDAEPVAPVFHWEIQDLAGNVYSIDIDLSAWDSTALFFRRLQLLVFTVGLAMASRKFIKW